MSNITLNSFIPSDDWVVCYSHQNLSNPNAKPSYIIDSSTDCRYPYKTQNSLRLKYFYLLFCIPTVCTIAYTAFRILRIVFLYHFWAVKRSETTYSLKDRCRETGMEFLKILTVPIAVVGLELTAAYGIFSPYNALKIYASIEKVQDNLILIPSFQPVCKN